MWTINVVPKEALSKLPFAIQNTFRGFLGVFLGGLPGGFQGASWGLPGGFLRASWGLSNRKFPPLFIIA